MKPVPFDAPWGTRVRLITLGVLAFAVVMTVVALISMMPADGRATHLRWLLPLNVVVVFGGAALFAVRGYDVGDEFLEIRRSLWRTRIPLVGLESAELDPEALVGARKGAGSDGYFGVYGGFTSPRLGRFRVFVTDLEKMVVLRWPDRTVVVSPDRPGKFIREIESRRQDREGGR